MFIQGCVWPAGWEEGQRARELKMSARESRESNLSKYSEERGLLLDWEEVRGQKISDLDKVNVP